MEAEGVERGVRRQVSSEPVYLGGCSGWLHGGRGSVAVLLCPAMGWDGLHAHHSFRRLADGFAAAGYPVLRFHYLGTGDSADLPGDGRSGHWDTWRANTGAAADWLRRETGATRVLFVGLRFGATVALAAAEARTDLAGLLLLAPVLRGKSYLRQLDMEARLEGCGTAPPPDGGLDLHELQFDAATVERLSRLDMRQAALPPGVPVALVPQAPSELAEACAEGWRGAGVPVQTLPFAGLEPLLQEAIHSDPAEPDFATVLRWASVAAPPSPLPALAEGAHRAAALADGRFTESPLRFGPGGALFGVLCRPAGGESRQAVVIGNTGRDPHYGIGRFGVQLARGLAAAGVASLRLDFAGLGDSPSPGGDRLSALFDADRNADFTHAVDALERLGFRQFAVHGLCSGAYHAFRAAQADPRIGTALLVNLPVFLWQGGDSVKAAMWSTASGSRLLQRLRDRAAWRRALSGQVDLRPFVRARVRRLRDGAARCVPRVLRGPPHPERAVAALAARGVRTLFVYSAGDPGLDMLEAAFGPAGTGLAAFPGAAARVLTGVDHILSGRGMRETVVNLLASFLADDGRRSADHDDPFHDPRTDDHHRRLAEADARAVA